MKSLLIFLCSFIYLYGADATIEVVKKVDSIPSIAVEDSSINYRGKVTQKFFRSLVGDLNVLAMFNVDREYNSIGYDADNVLNRNRASNFVLRYRLRQDDGAHFICDVKLISNKKVMINKTYKISSDKLAVFVAHSVAYDINKYFNGDNIDWIKRKVVFARLSASGKSEIIISDYSLSYQHVIIKGGLNLFPKWANKKQDTLYYTSLSGSKPTLFKYKTSTGYREKVIDSDGMLVCSDVSQDSERLLLTMAPNGQPDIYEYNVRNRQLYRATFYKGIDVNAQFMGNDKITFVSNRLGYPNVFSKNIHSKAVEQLVYYGKSNSACSAYKDYIVYKARESRNAFDSNTFNLHLISTKTDFIRRLTATGVNEFPRFSHDGGAILYIKNYKNQSSIGIIRVDQNKNYLFPLKRGKIQSLDW